MALQFTNHKQVVVHKDENTYVGHDMNYVVCFPILNCSEIFQENCGEDIDEVVWCHQELV